MEMEGRRGTKGERNEGKEKERGMEGRRRRDGKEREGCRVSCITQFSFATVEVRCAESAKIRGKYQDRIPVSY